MRDGKGVEARCAGVDVEFRKTTGAGTAMAGQAEVPRHFRAFARHDMLPSERHARQFTAACMRLGARLPHRVGHLFNIRWFRSLRKPGPAYGNLRPCR